MNLEQFILRLCPTHAALEKEVIALRGELALAEAKLEMAEYSREAARVAVPRKAPIVRTTSWRQFQEKISDLQEKEQ